MKKRIQMMFHKKKNFSGSSENFMKNGRLLLEESITLFDGRTNPIRCLSVDELNTVVLDPDHLFYWGVAFNWYRGVWEGNTVLVAVYETPSMMPVNICLDIVVSSQMGIHNNALQLLGCCLETEHPFLIFEGAEIKGTLHDRLLGFGDESQRDPPLEWKDRLRIAWEISYALAYLHTAFPRPIIYRDLTTQKVFLDQNNVAKLSDFSFSISIPKGKTFVEDMVIGTAGYSAPEYMCTGRVTEKVDVHSFGVVLLMLLTGKPNFLHDADHSFITLVEWARNGLEEERTSEMVDPAIIKGNKKTMSEELWQQWQQSLKLALRCVSTEEDNRPTMEEVATLLKNIIRSFVCS